MSVGNGAPRVACILLAAGMGTRFGGDKLLHMVDGRPMAAHAIELHAAAPYIHRILVTQRRHETLAALAAANGFCVSYNDEPERGIASSIRIGAALLAASGIRPDGVLFGVCDQPYLGRDTLWRLLDAFAASPARIVAPCHAGRRGNPVIFPARFLPALSALTGDTGGSAIIRANPEALLLVPVADERELIDIDRRPPA